MKQAKEPIMTKSFSAAGVLGVYTGIVCTDEGFGPIHEVMDFFFPGIMTIGCALMLPKAQEEILRQHPRLAELGLCPGDWYKQWYEAAVAMFGSRFELSNEAFCVPQTIKDEVLAIRQIKPEIEVIGIQLKA